MKRIIALLPLVSLAGCLAHPDPPPPPYRALGTEPFWNLLIDPLNLTFIQPEGEPIVQPAPKPVLGPGGQTYQSARIGVTVVRGQTCSDGMSDRVYPDTVRVTVDGRPFSGCGGL